jgi:hypothetical protein
MRLSAESRYACLPGKSAQVVDFPLIAGQKKENAGKCHSESGPLGAA